MILHEKKWYGVLDSKSNFKLVCLYMRGKGSRTPKESMTIGTQLILASKGIEYPLLVDFNVIPTVRPRLVSLCRRNDSVVRIGDAYCYSKAICKLVWC